MVSQMAIANQPEWLAVSMARFRLTDVVGGGEVGALGEKIENVPNNNMRGSDGTNSFAAF